MSKSKTILMITAWMVPAFGVTALATEYADWTLSGTGQRPAPGILEISGDGSGSGQWRSPAFDLKPNGYYKFSVSHRGADTKGGCMPSL